ncbi:mitochondrial ribosomal subunit protein-domain-containing protein [Dactylonectria estremocensis]|uniref:Mitochondrial ribosomal subunit protein-domain-containing protein n=1 Tax=Dactylonectria estremocensis TaxID=1079267 RepID=A0A9P9F0J0_9HYPO|nr:mitochondrial ribosomal subunit protein-domain-containing protein [Dactylonectria estremocensis]
MASASAAARLCVLACRGAYRLQRIPQAQHITRQSLNPHRSFTTSTIRWAREGEEEDDAEDYAPIVLRKLTKSFNEAITPEGMKQLDELAKENGYNTIDDYLQDTIDRTPGWGSEDRGVLDDLMKTDKGEKPNKQSFWYDDEDPETNTEELDEFDEDDITSMAHGKLDQIREMRNYARLAVWEMPLLSKLAKPFTPPAEGQVLRWRYTTYMGESHPAEKKVVVQFAPNDLKLTAVQTEKLKKLAGPRYNPETNIIKMSCESYEQQAQNKRYLSNLIDDLITAAKDSKDTFADIPLDVRHHQFQNKPKFPKEWYLTPKRVNELAELRKSAALLDLQKTDDGLLIDGGKILDEYLMKKNMEAEAERQRTAELLLAEQPVRPLGGYRVRR